jgi:hypothetical protein
MISTLKVQRSQKFVSELPDGILLNSKFSLFSLNRSSILFNLFYSANITDYYRYYDNLIKNSLNVKELFASGKKKKKIEKKGKR